MAGSALLVPLHLDVLVHSEQSHNEGSFAWFEVDYGKLASFEDPVPAAFTQEGGPKPGYGVYLHWALPDALTRGDGNNPKGITFGSVPDRWLIGRFNAAGDTWINKFWVIESDFTGDEGSSVFLDPAQTSTPDAVHSTKIGRPIDITAYKSSPTENSGYLQAVSPGNVAFAAFAPFNHNVFSFVDDDVLQNGGGKGADYTYLVIGWYSNPEKHDPLRGAANPVGNSIWKDEGAWKAALKEERFAALCEHLKWSVKGEPAAEEVPDHILCHGLVHGVDTSHSNPDQKRFQAQDVQIVVANTAVDALARLIQAEAAQQAGQDKDQGESWRKAGTDLERLLRAAQYDLLKTLDEPGGQARLEQQIRDHWFGSKASGTRWEVASRVPQQAGDYPDLPRLSAEQQEALDQRLATLNKAQRQFDDDLNQLAGLQAELYHLWWKRKQAAVSGGRVISGFHIGGHPTLQPENNTAPWDTVISKMADELDAMNPDSLAHQVWQLAWKIQGDAQGLPPPYATAEQLADWADKNFFIPAQLADLKLELKAAATARFYHPSDPVVLIKGLQRARKHGEDGRYNEDGSLSCRLQGQTITGLSNPAVRAVDLPRERIDLDPTGDSNLPDVGFLVEEAFWVDPGNASLMALAGGDAKTICDALTQGLASWQEAQENCETNVSLPFEGCLPAPFAATAWEQAWAPLFLEWQVSYFPSGKVDGDTLAYDADDWRFDGHDYHWQGKNKPEQGNKINVSGRSILTPHAAQLFQGKIKQYLTDHAAIDSTTLRDLEQRVGGWDVLSQSLSGLTDTLVMRRELATFPPDGAGDSLPQSDPAQATSPPSPGALIGRHYRNVPLQGGLMTLFYPFRAGFFQIEQLRVVDTFGQKIDLHEMSAERIFEPKPGLGLKPDHADELDAHMFQLPPRLVQPSRLDFQFLANDDSGLDITIAQTPHAVCGWLIPDHLDGGLAVYSSKGEALGEILPAEFSVDDERSLLGGIDNAALCAVVSSFVKHKQAYFDELLQVIDETIWLVDPLGGRKDQMLSVMMGRPLAVVQAELGITFDGPLYHDQALAKMWVPQTPADPGVPAQGPWKRIKDSGPITSLSIPVRLGNVALRSEGLLGYFVDNNFDALFVTHLPADLQQPYSYIQPIYDPIEHKSSYISLPLNGKKVTVTMIIDPRGAVHAATGLFPVKEIALPVHPLEQFLRHLRLQFRAGPLLSTGEEMAMPQPADKRVTWSWLPEKLPIVDAGKLLLFPHEPLVIHEGWLEMVKKEE